MRSWTYDALQPVTWDNKDMGGTTVFSYPGRGYFAVYLRLTWYADNIGPGGTWEDIGRSYEYLNGASAGYCAYSVAPALATLVPCLQEL